jgi:hypothetical protein
MISPVLVDFSGTIDEFLLTEQETKDLSRFVLSNISDEYMRHWEQNIDSSLHQTRSEYKQAIFTEQPDDFSMVFGMTPRKSKLAMMLEEGASSFDIKSGFEQSDKKKRKKDGGWYLTIPFRHATSTAIAESMTFSGRMPNEIEKLVKVSEKPLNLSDLPEGYKDKRVSRAGYKHKAAIIIRNDMRKIKTILFCIGFYLTIQTMAGTSILTELRYLQEMETTRGLYRRD